MARNFYIHANESAPVGGGSPSPKLGVWHVLPASVSEQLASEPRDGLMGVTDRLDERMEESLGSGAHPIVIYLHGNGSDRTASGRVRLYNRLSASDSHVLAPDYRGYGDSEGHPTEDGLVEDMLRVIHYTRRVAPNKRIHVWGHSMGTGVAVRMVAELSDAGSQPDALVLGGWRGPGRVRKHL